MVVRKKLFDFFLSVLAASAMLAPTASIAGDWQHRPRVRHCQDVVGVNGLPSRICGLGTFSGGVSAVRIRGVGNYFYIQRNVGKQLVNPLRPKAKVVSSRKGTSCSMENGVCVIRPQQ